MGSFAVVVREVDAEDLFKLPAADDQDAGRGIRRGRCRPSDPCTRSHLARTGVWMTLIPSLSRRASNVRGNFASRSWIRNRTCRSWSSRPMSRLRAFCSIQAMSGLLVIAKYAIRRLPIKMKASK